MQNPLYSRTKYMYFSDAMVLFHSSAVESTSKYNVVATMVALTKVPLNVAYFM